MNNEELSYVQKRIKAGMWTAIGGYIFIGLFIILLGYFILDFLSEYELLIDMYLTYTMSGFSLTVGELINIIKIVLIVSSLLTLILFGVYLFLILNIKADIEKGNYNVTKRIVACCIILFFSNTSVSILTNIVVLWLVKIDLDRYKYLQGTAKNPRPKIKPHHEHSINSNIKVAFTILLVVQLIFIIFGAHEILSGTGLYTIIKAILFIGTTVVFAYNFKAVYDKLQAGNFKMALSLSLTASASATFSVLGSQSVLGFYVGLLIVIVTLYYVKCENNININKELDEKQQPQNETTIVMEEELVIEY